MYTLPSLLIDQVAIRIDDNRVAHFCEEEWDRMKSAQTKACPLTKVVEMFEKDIWIEQNVSSWVDFDVLLDADSDDFEITAILMGAIELKGPAFDWARSFIEDAYSHLIHEHIGKHLQDAKDDDAYDAWEFHAGVA